MKTATKLIAAVVIKKYTNYLFATEITDSPARNDKENF